MECTLHVLLNIDPKLRVKPHIMNHALAVQMYGKASMLVMCESNPNNKTEVYERMQPAMIRLFIFGDDILICLEKEIHKCFIFYCSDNVQIDRTWPHMTRET